MFSQTYQNGDYGIEIFSPSGNDPFKLCKLANESNIQKVYDRDVKGYMVSMEDTHGITLPTRAGFPQRTVSHRKLVQILLVA
jgi:hypothetical protein